MSFTKETSMAPSEKLLYTAKVRTRGGREGGHARSSDGYLDVRISVPGAPNNGTNPEQLFAAGWSACFESAMALVARKMKVALPADYAIDAEVDLNMDGDGYFLRARLNVSLPGLKRNVVERVVEAADKTCPYSKATRHNVEVAINLI
jgi:Ohr subfamily peroxiredoxin